MRVVIAEDHALLREGIVALLREHDIEVVAQAEDGEGLVRIVGGHKPDLAIVDVRLPPTFTDEGIRAAGLLAERGLQTGIVVLSNYADPSYAVALLDSGAPGRAYLLKERVHDRAQLASAIHAVAVGGSVIDPKIIEPLIAMRARNERSPLADLTPREREVLAHIAEGKSNAAIAGTLVLTKRAVEKHINSIFMKLGLLSDENVSRRVKATLMFLADVNAAHLVEDGGQPDIA